MEIYTPIRSTSPPIIFASRRPQFQGCKKLSYIDLKKSQSMLCSPRGVPIVVDTYDTISVVVEDSVRFVFFWFDFQSGLACAFAWYCLGQPRKILKSDI